MGRDKTILLIKARYFLLHLMHDVEKFIKHSYTTQTTKRQTQNIWLYKLFPILVTPWKDLFIDFILGLLQTQWDSYYIFVVVDHFSNMAHFIPCKKTLYATYIVQLFFREIVCFYELPKLIVFDDDNKFLSHFWHNL